MDRVEIKKKAKEFAFANKWNIWKGILLTAAISTAASMVLNGILFAIKLDDTIISLFSFVLELALMPMAVGLASYFIKVVNKKDVVLTDELFARYKDGSMWKIILVFFVSGLIIGLMSLLLIIPGIIFAIKYAMTTFILAEESLADMEKEPAYKTSDKMMNGHKMEYFIFQLSFILWYIGCSFTFGILAIWAVPYITTANVMWYENLKKISK